MEETPFITTYSFAKDRNKEGRLLETTQVGDGYISRATIDPKAVLGNLYYKTTSFMCFVETGRVRLDCQNLETKEKKEIMLSPGMQAAHVPPGVAFSFKNLDPTPTVVIFFSNKLLRSPDNDGVDYLLNA